MSFLAALGGRLARASPRVAPLVRMPPVSVGARCMSTADLSNSRLKEWIQDKIDLCQPSAVHIVTGSVAVFSFLRALVTCACWNLCGRVSANGE